MPRSSLTPAALQQPRPRIQRLLAAHRSALKFVARASFLAGICASALLLGVGVLAMLAALLGWTHSTPTSFFNEIAMLVGLGIASIVISLLGSYLVLAVISLPGQLAYVSAGALLDRARERRRVSADELHGSLELAHHAGGGLSMADAGELTALDPP